MVAASKELPINAFKDQIADAVRNSNVVVLVGETGSGKTTQLPQILLDEGLAGDDGVVAVTQPRRVAAVTVARRVAFERDVEVGTQVGYAVRFEERCNSRTRIKYLTDGTLLRECLSDALLSRYRVIVLDEAHERSLNTDILFGIVKGLLQSRKDDLKVIVTSATLDTAKVSAYFNDCPVLHIPGRVFPVEVVYAMEDHVRDYTRAAIDVVLDVHTQQPAGDILVFLTGQAEIDKAVRTLKEEIASLPSDECGTLLVLPLYAALPPELQARVFVPPPEGCRRCIIATNIAETSITVDGVVYVVDSGMVKEKEYDPATGMDSLQVKAISRVQAAQRAGRAGRTRPGKCFRLYTRKFHDDVMPNITVPEIQRTSLAGAVLHLKTLSLDIDVLKFDYLDPPPRQALEEALRQLYVLDAIDQRGMMTSLGRRMASVPLDVSLSRALIAARELDCMHDVITIAAMLSAEHIIIAQHDGRRDRDGGDGDDAEQERRRNVMKAYMEDGVGDHIFYLRLYQAWQRESFSKGFCERLGLNVRGMFFAKDVRRQLAQVCDEHIVIAHDSNGDSRRHSHHSDSNYRGGTTKHSHDDGAEDSDKKRRRSHADHETQPSKRSGTLVRNGGPDGIMAARKAIAIGFANKVAMRLRLHNGYRTCNMGGVLAQLHPSCAAMAVDGDGLLPPCIVYHELVATSRPFLRQVCAIEGSWVEDALRKMRDADVLCLASGKPTPQHEKTRTADGGDAAAAAAGATAAAAAAVARRNDDKAVTDARARYLARKSGKR